MIEEVVCKKCLLLKPSSEFYIRKENGHRRSECKSCWNLRATVWVKKNPEKRRANALKWAKNNYPYLRMKKAEYRKRDPIRMRKWSLEHPELKKELNRRWKRENRWKITASTRARQAMKINATPKWANLAAIERLYKKADILGMHVDHVIPLRHKLVCGLHVESNLQILTPSDNFRKGNRWP